MVVVFDACAIIAFLRNENGADVIEKLLLDPNTQCMVHAINLCEVYYDFLRVTDQATAQSAVGDVNTMGVVVREDMDTHLWQEAGMYKATEKVSLADCFALALTNKVRAELVTSDHHEFDPIAERGICPINFFR